MKIIMVGVKEYCEDLDVVLTTAYSDRERLVIKAYNEAGYNSTEVDLVDVILWLRKNRPELMEGK